MYKKSNVNKKKLKRVYQRRKVCRFCINPDLHMNYKNPESFKNLITERGKIIPRRITGTCAKHQRKLTTIIKRARAIAVLPYVGQIKLKK